MDPKAENVVQNIGAIAEAASIFYNTAVKQVPKDVALVLTRHFMDLTMARRDLSPAMLAKLAQAAAREAQRREQEKQTQTEQTQESPEEPEKS